MFTRSIAVDFDLVSQHTDTTDTFRREQARNIVQVWFWQVLHQSYQGIDGQIVMKDRLLDSL